MLRHVRYALRGLWLNKGFAAVAILCMGFGIGVNTTIFSIVDGILIQSLPYQGADRIVTLKGRNAKAGIDESAISYLEMVDWQKGGTTVQNLSGLSYRTFTVSDGIGEPERYPGADVTWNLFPLLGKAPQLGRPFAEADDRPGAADVVMLSDILWRRRYNADPGIVGRRILINEAPFEVIGVMPPDFEFPERQQLWVPLVPHQFSFPRDRRSVQLFGRLGPGVNVDRAQQDFSGVAARVAALYPATNENWDAFVQPMKDDFTPPDVVLVISLMMAGATLVLLIACSNVANLLLARASVRQREISIRAALGAGRGQVIRQLLTESVVLGLASVPLGLLLAKVGSDLIASAVPRDQVPYYIRWAVDWRSVLYGIAVATGMAVLFGLVPAWQVTRGNLHETLKEGTRGNTGSRGWTRNVLVAVEVALSLVALIGALLFVRTFENLDTFNIGFDPRPLTTMRFYMAGPAYDMTDAKRRRVQDIVQRVEALPGVEAVGASNLVPIDGGGGGGDVIVEGQPVESGRRQPIRFSGVSPHFFRALGVAVRGQDFDPSQSWLKTPVAIVNQTMADRYWKNRTALGARFRLDDPATPDWFTVIGVVPDILQDDVDPSSQPESSAYVPYAYQESLNTGLVIRVNGDPAAIAPAAREAIRAADRNLPVFAVATMNTVRAKSFWQYGLFGWIFSGIGLVGLGLASVGVYGVLSYSVSQRTQEIGVRMALGAGRGDIVTLIVWQGVKLALFGVAAGLVIAAYAMPKARSLLYNVSPFDPISFAVVALFLPGVAALASYVPARRAMRVNPTQALRGE